MDEAGNDDIGRGKDGRKPFIKQAGDDATDTVGDPKPWVWV